VYPLSNTLIAQALPALSHPFQTVPSAPDPNNAKTKNNLFPLGGKSAGLKGSVNWCQWTLVDVRRRWYWFLSGRAMASPGVELAIFVK